SDTIDRVQDIILKRKLKIDSEVQTIEDALCLVFLEFQYDDLIAKHSDEKIVNILRKTWCKMTDQGKKVALTLNFTEKGTLLLKSEEHTSELQSRENLVCRLLLEKKKKKTDTTNNKILHSSMKY